MEQNNISLLTINGGSSGIKFSLYKITEPLTQILYGEIKNMDKTNAKLHFTYSANHQKINKDIDIQGRKNIPGLLIDFLVQQYDMQTVSAIGHRIVHGMKHTNPQRITPQLLRELKKISNYDPEHLPGEISLIEAFAKRFSEIPQVACFDTAFHSTMPAVAKLLPIPRRYYKLGIQRYGFHGLSYAYLLEELEKIAGEETAQGKIIMAHLGNGASLAAVIDGECIETSMGFTPASGIPMGTRPGDLDPGIAWYLMQFEKLNPDQFNKLINHESGLLGISETSSDMQELLKIQSTDSRAAEAIELFCYQVIKWIGSFNAVLGGLNTLVFSGGIGTHAPEIRSRICARLQFLGIELEETKNLNNEAIISTDASKVCVRVIKTNEELMIAKMTRNVLEIENK